MYSFCTLFLQYKKLNRLQYKTYCLQYLQPLILCFILINSGKTKIIFKMINTDSWQIGNVIKLSSGKITKIKAIKKRKGKFLFFVEGKNKAFKISELFPVSITESILENAGFVRTMNPNPEFEVEYMTIEFESGQWNITDLNGGSLMTYLPVNYVNELQNFLVLTESIAIANNF